MAYKGLKRVTSGNRSFRKKKGTRIVRGKSDTRPDLKADSKSLLGDMVLFWGNNFFCIEMVGLRDYLLVVLL